LTEECDVDPTFTEILATAFPGEQPRYFLPMSIGTTTADADEGATLILNGTKTATSSPFWEYPDGRIPFAGSRSDASPGSCRSQNSQNKSGV
jgi:hypothetical protein